jgi:hypothetical protein
VSSTGSDPTTTLVPAAEAPLAAAVAEALLEVLLELVVELLLELLQAVTRIAATARLAAVTGTRLIGLAFIFHSL